MRPTPGFAKHLRITVLLVLGFAVWLATGLGGDTVVRYVDDLATAAAALVAALLCLRTARSLDGRSRAFWALFAAACAAWTVGETTWAVYDLQGGVPAASWADVGYLGALPPVVVALLAHPAVRGRALATTRSLIDGLVLAAAFFFLGWTVVLEPLQRTVALTSLDGLVTLAYPVADVVVLFLVVLVIRGTTSRDRIDLWCLLAGLLLIGCSDATYTYLTQVREFATGSVVDVGWFGGYLAIALAAVARVNPVVERRSPTRATLTTAAVVAPFVAIVGALSLVAGELELSGPVSRVTFVAAFALVLLVLLRQALLLLDVSRAVRAETGVTVSAHVVAALGGSAVAQDARRRQEAEGLSS